MPLPALSRRALIAGTGATIATAAMAIPYVSAARAGDVCSISSAAETVTDRVMRLSQELSAALGEYEDGSWSIRVGADNNISLQPRATGSARYRAEIHLAQYRKAMMEADPTITGWDVSYDIDTGGLTAIILRRKA